MINIDLYFAPPPNYSASYAVERIPHDDLA